MSFQFQKPLIAAAGAQSYCHSVCEGQTFVCISVRSATSFIFIFFKSLPRTLCSAFNFYRKVDDACASHSFFFLPLRSTVACAFNTKHQGDQRQQCDQGLAAGKQR